MKKSIYILTLIIMSLLSFGATAQTQNEELKLCIYPYDVCVSDFLYETIVPKKYRKDINGIKRDNQSVINLKSKKDFYSKIRIETDKGRISCGYIKEVTPFYREVREVKEGELIDPINITYWKISRLNGKDKEITIKAYLNKTDELIGQKTYKLNPDTIPVYKPRLIFTDLNGNKRTVDRRLNDLPINRNIPMQLVVDDGWGKTYKPRGRVSVRDGGVMYNVLPQFNQNPDSIIIRNINSFTISDIMIITNDTSSVLVEPIVY